MLIHNLFSKVDALPLHDEGSGRLPVPLTLHPHHTHISHPGQAPVLAPTNCETVPLTLPVPNTLHPHLTHVSHPCQAPVF